MEAIKLDQYSYEDYLDIDKTTKDDERVELIFGEIYMMSGASAKHQDIVGNIFYNIQTGKKVQNCKPRIAPYDIKINIKGDISVVQPDVMIFCTDEIMPCAVFEVLSPSTAAKDKGVKKDLYEAAKIKEYYIINTEYKIIDKYILDHGKYYYVKGYSQDEIFIIECTQQEIVVSDIFKDVE